MAASEAKEPATLLSLPNELQAMILEPLLCFEDPVKVLSRWDRRRMGIRVGLGKQPRMNILLSCKQLRDVGLDLLYCRNTFRLVAKASSCDNPQWIWEIGLRNLAKLTSLTLVLSMAKSFDMNGSDECPIARRVEHHVQRANLLKGWINGISLISFTSKLRHLEITLPTQGYHADNIISMVTFLRSVCLMKTLQSFRLIGGDLNFARDIPGLILLYLNRRLRIPIKHPRLQCYFLGLRDGILQLEEEMESTRLLIIESSSRTTSSIPELPSSFADTDWIEPSEDRVQCHTSRLFYLFAIPAGEFDDPRHYQLTSDPARGNDQYLPVLFRGLNLFTAQKELHSGKFWPQVNFHKREFEILGQKRQFLIEFWEELKLLGILRKKKKVESDARNAG
ncbi:hypothetical protein BU26DRAFT_292907 [Trematosphaeria pertusa]|uniref:F-box domain-containing protein n=1 Tax=Trematosphaeria pertusa TaxID=390896 RepID=A0A6A6IID2_9PLEO|nr:uncharacterized protein BU26DRAFT_292907 [Trematosphaeria pertusa]KAF2249937.1 hypothetical protein BU26DRAFT_292907 [Trematosphaeria pertusa]